MNDGKRVIALGFFDGVHLGHAALLGEAAALARRLDARPAAITFDKQPARLLGDPAARLLCGVEERRALMRACCGVEEMLVLPFDDAFRRMPWERFVTEELAGRFRAAGVVAGDDYRFGFRGEGNAARLRELCEKLNLRCRIVEKVRLDGIVVSSSHIRRLLADGKAAEAARFLGHPHLLGGVVARGRGLGGRLGIPTVNLELGAEILTPARGVYAARVITEDGESHAAVTNIGVRPTVDDSGRVTVESWLLDFQGDLYGARLRVALYAYLRPERKFSSVGELTRAIHANAAEVRALFAAEHSFFTDCGA